MRRTSGHGSLVRLLVVALLVVVSIGSASAGAILPTDRAFQGASWDVSSSQRDRDADDEETPDDDDKDIPEDEETPDDDDNRNRGDDDDDLDPDWEDAGLISATEYESPLYGYTVEWDDPWEVDEYYDDCDDCEGSVATDVDGADLLYLWDPESFAMVYVQGFESNGSTIDDIVDFLESSDFFTTTDGDDLDGEILDIEIDDETVAMVYWYEINGNTYVRYLEYAVIDNGDAFSYAAFSAPSDEFEDMFVSARETIEIDGDEAFSLMRERAVLAALDDLP